MPKAAGQAGGKKSGGAVKKEPERWKLDPEDHDFPAALDYLSLVLKPAQATRVVDSLKAADTVRRKARDLLRAAALPLLPASDALVASDLKKVRRGIPLSPVLLIRGDASKGRALTVADGYHRICASYTIDLDLDIPCRIADLS